VPLSNHHHAAVAVAVARFNVSAPLLDFDATIQGDSSRFHNDVIVDCFSAIYHSVNLFDSAPERFGEFLVVGIETLIAQRLEHMLGVFLAGTLVVNLLIEHHTDSCSLFCSRSQFVLPGKLAQVKCHRTERGSAGSSSSKSREVKFDPVLPRSVLCYFHSP
jgi:hypothetical protein